MKQINIDNYTDKDMKALLESLEVREVVDLTTENLYDLGEERFYDFLPNLLKRSSAMLPVGKDYELFEQVILPIKTELDLHIYVRKANDNTYDINFNFNGVAYYNGDIKEDSYLQNLNFNLEEMIDFKFLQILNK